MAQNEGKAMKFTWKLENYSYCWNKTDDFLQSPVFQMNIIHGTSWFLKLYPRGVSSYENYVSVHLGRSESCKGPLAIKVDYEIALLRPDGTAEYVKEAKDRCIRRGYAFGFDNLAPREEILGEKRSELLPNDTLTVQCRIFPKEVELKRHTEIIAKTHNAVERLIFLVESKITESLSFGNFIHICSLSSLRDTQEMVIILYGIPYDAPKTLEFLFILGHSSSIKAFYTKIGILDSNSIVSRYLINQYRDCSTYDQEYSFKTNSSVSVDEILKRKSLYLPNDTLTLHYDLTVSFGVQYSQLVTVACNKAFTFVPTKPKAPSELDLPLKKYSCSCTDNYSSLKNDFQNLYQEQTVCDFTIKVGNENLQVHKAVLCARSPVFKAMLTSNMKECNKNILDITDLELDTVRRMLTFMYTDTIDGLDWEKANKLYFAADKYALLPLKRICSDLLKQNLSVANVEAVLTLANMHADEDLKKTTLEFVCEHELEVMCSMEWKTFMTEELKLAAEIMHQIFLKKAGK